MPNPLIALRVAPRQWMEPQKTEELLAWLGTRPGLVDEIALFTAYTHPPLPLGEMQDRCARLREVMRRMRREGYRVGVNVLATMGHHEENLPGSLDAPWPRVTDPDGRVSLGSYCPASPELLAYTEKLYALTAQTGPDFIWVDDDVRLMGHMPVRATCFCDACIARFNQEVGGEYTRESLVAAMGAAPSPERDALRARWLERNRQMIARLLRTAAEAAHGVDPTLSLGFMTGDRFLEGYGFREWADALEGPQSPPARWRPGGGFYTDDAYMGLVDKAHDIGRQVSQLPQKVTLIQSEIENFPYQLLTKSVAVTMLEGVAHMAAGAMGLALNIIGDPDDIAEYTPFLSGVQGVRPFAAKLASSAGRSAPEGVWPAWNRDIFADRQLEGDWLNRNQNTRDMRLPYVLGELGLPIAYGPEGARVTALAGSLPLAFSVAELERIFAGGVLLDGPALQALEQLGLQEWAGVRVAEVFDKDALEVLADHPLNQGHVGWRRDCRQSFWPQLAYHLEPLASGVETLSSLADYQGHDLGSCVTAYTNSLGGRVVVSGYSPWYKIHNLCKVDQLRAACRWLSRDTLPAVVETYARVVVWARRNAQGGLVLVVMNASLDAIPELALRVRAGGGSVAHWSLSAEPSTVMPQPDGPEHVRVRLPNVAPWSVHLLSWEG